MERTVTVSKKKKIPRGKTFPYSQDSIRRVPCSRCGKPSFRQWNICSLDGKFFGVCKGCDVLFNEVVLKFMRFTEPQRSKILEAYRENQKYP